MTGFELMATNQVKLTASREANCSPYPVEAPPPLAPAPGRAPVFYCGYPRSGGAGPNRTLDGRQMTMSALVKALTRGELHRPVVDKTGLAGTFDIHLAWTSDSPAAPDSADAISIFTALREQLGLQLEPARAWVRRDGHRAV